MNGTVSRWTQTEYYGIGAIRGDDDRKWNVSGSSVELDCTGKVMLIPGESVEFDEGRYTDKHQKTHRAAINVRRPWKDDQTDWHTHREVVKVISEHRLLRLTGGLLTPTNTYDYQDILVPGYILECGIKPPGKGRMWCATDLKYLFSCEEDWVAASEAGNV